MTPCFGRGEPVPSNKISDQNLMPFYLHMLYLYSLIYLCLHVTQFHISESLVYVYHAHYSLEHDLHTLYVKLESFFPLLSHSVDPQGSVCIVTK